MMKVWALVYLKECKGKFGREIGKEHAQSLRADRAKPATACHVRHPATSFHGVGKGLKSLGSFKMTGF